MQYSRAYQIIMCASLASLASLSPNAWSEPLQFPMGIYSSDNEALLKEARPRGWNITQAYLYQKSPEERVKAAAKIGIQAKEEGYSFIAQFPKPEKSFAALTLPEEEAYFAEVEKIARQALRMGNVAAWGYPEEIKCWDPTERSFLQKFDARIKALDPAHEIPRLMYIPGHWKPSLVASCLPFIDMLSISLYSQNYGYPHSWAPWRTEELMKLLTSEGITIGTNYARGEKLPVSFLELYEEQNKNKEPRPRIVTRAGVRHDFWTGILHGAHGIFLYSGVYRDKSPALQAAWKEYQYNAALLTGPQGMLPYLLTGKRREISVEVLEGPKGAPSFVPVLQKDLQQINSVRAAEFVRPDGKAFLVIINSAQDPVKVRLPVAKGSSCVPLEKNSSVLEREGEIVTPLPPLGVLLLVRK